MNGIGWETWLAFGVGTASSLVLILRYWRQDPEADSLRAQRDDAQQGIEFCYAQLRELEDQKAKLDPDNFNAQVAALETEAAAHLKRLDALGTEQPLPPVVGLTSGMSPQMKGFAWGAGMMGLAFALTISVLLQQQPQATPAPSAPNAQAAPNSRVQELLSRLQQDPKDVSSMLGLARILLRQQMFGEAETLINRALQYDPSNPVGKVLLAVLRAAKGEPEDAIKDIERVLATHPKVPEGWFFRGMLNMQRGNTDAMQESFARYLEVAPDGPLKERVRAMTTNTGNPKPE